MGKPTIRIGENKGADQFRSYCEADQRLCFRYTDSTIPLLSKSKNFQAGLCRTWLEPKLLFFSRTGSFHLHIFPLYFSCDVCWNEKVMGGDDVVTDLVMPFDPLAESNDDDTLVG